MSKSAILAAVKRNKPVAQVPLPTMPVFPKNGIGAVETFIAVAETSGSQVMRIQQVEAALQKRFPGQGIIASSLSDIQSTIDLETITSPSALEHVDIAVVKGQLGVAENGAIWITETDCGHRVLPFICQHLVVLLDQADIVQTMHEAYEKIRVDAQGYGIFIAGPSKTADIEQALVIGAQAARSLTVFLTNGNAP